MSYDSGVHIELKIDESKITVIRGPASCRNIALSYLRGCAEHLANDSDLLQAIAWLEKMEV